MQQLLTTFLFIAAILFSLKGKADTRITVGVTELPNLLSSNPRLAGPYNELLANFNELELLYAPPGRIGLLWDQKKLDCLFPGSYKSMPNKQHFIVSDSANKVEAYLFTLAPYDSIKQLEDKTIAIRRGFSYGKIRERFSAEFVELESELALVEFLKLKRVDAIIAYHADIAASIKITSEKMPFYLATSPIYEVDDAFLCHKNSKNQLFIESANNVIHNWKLNGSK